MSLAYYGLSFNPFDKQMVQEKDRFLSRDMTEMTQRLDYLKDARGIGVFTARPGMGKSFCLRCFAKSLNPNLYHMEYICLSTVSVMEFYRQFCAALGVSDKGGKPGMFKSIQEQIWYLYKEKRQPLLLHRLFFSPSGNQGQGHRSSGYQSDAGSPGNGCGSRKAPLYP